MIIFQVTLGGVLNDTKTQTRRVKKDGEWYSPSRCAVMRADGRVKWYVGQEHAICPGRGKKQVGRLKIKVLRWENLQDITEEDARAEGIDEHYFDHVPNFKACIRPGWFYRAAYADLWDRLYEHQPDKRIDANPPVWVIEFERVA
jgi:hypothetical protein